MDAMSLALMSASTSSAATWNSLMMTTVGPPLASMEDNINDPDGGLAASSATCAPQVM